LQLIPYGRNHTNPPVISEPTWNSPETQMLAERACYDCHSNETKWPWYSNIAPVSWLVQRDVDEGRRALNFSDWGSSGEEGEELGEVIYRGSMPPSKYLITHPEARLSDAEKQALAQGMTSASFGEVSPSTQTETEHESGEHAEDESAEGEEHD
jgi:hypothetical protein